MARGEWCARHDRYFGNIVPCQDCQREAQGRQAREQLRMKPRYRWTGACGAWWRIGPRVDGDDRGLYPLVIYGGGVSANG